MDYERLFTVADTARAGKALTPADRALVARELPEELASFPKIPLPRNVRHPAGFPLSGAPVGTFLRSALLLAGQRGLGTRYGGSLFYERVERDLAFGIMRSHFHNGYPKGAYCCSQCTLAVFPVLEAGAIRHFDCRELARNVEQLIRREEWRFTRPPNPRMLRWSLRN